MSWKCLTIGDITEVVTKGTTPTTIGKPFVEQGVNYVKAEALNGDAGLDIGGFAHIDEETHQLLQRSILREDDVLVTIAGAKIGKCGYVKLEHLSANTNQAVGIVRVDKRKAVPRFVYYFFKQPATYSMIQSMGVQAAQPNLNLSSLGKILIRLPALTRQQSIANTLSAYDALIENNSRRIQLLEESARLLYKEWFVYLRFPGHEHVKVVDGVPEGWESKKISDVAKINSKSLKNGFHGTIEYIDIASVSPGKIDETSTIDFKDAPSRARRIVQHGDIIWSCVRPNRGSHAIIWNPTGNLIASTGFAVLCPEKVPTSYLYQFTTTPAFVGYLSNNAKGVAYPAVSAKDFEDAGIIVPSASLLLEFDEVVRPIIDMITQLNYQNKKLKQARDLLLPRLMNGEIEV